MAPGVIVVLGSPLTMPGACPCPVAPVGSVAITVEVRSALRWRGGPSRVPFEGCFIPVKNRTVTEGSCSCLPMVLQRRKYKE
jgi:hypothetical protein